MSHHEMEHHQKEPAGKAAATSKEAQQPAEHAHEQGHEQEPPGKRPETAPAGQSGSRRGETDRPRH